MATFFTVGKDCSMIVQQFAGAPTSCAPVVSYFTTEAECAYKHLLQSYTENVNLRQYVLEVPKELSCKEKVKAVFERVMTRARSCGAEIPDTLNALDAFRLAKIARATDIVIVFQRLASKLPAARDVLQVEGDLYTRAGTFTRWMKDHPEDLAAVKRLSLSELELRYVPPQLGLCTGLIWLDLSRNNLVEVPAVFSAFQHLKRLDLGQNKLRALPTGIGALPLNTLELVNNAFQSLPRDLRPLVERGVVGF